MTDTTQSPRGWRDTLRHGWDRVQRAPLWVRITGSIAAVLALLVILFLLFFEWNMLRGPIGKFASARMNREVRLNGDLDVKLFSWSPTATVRGITVAEPDWRSRTDKMATVQSLTVGVRILPLFKGDVIMPILAVENPVITLYSDANGRNNWTFGDPNAPKKPTKLPAMEHVIIRNGQLRVTNVQKKITLTGTINSEEGGGSAGGFRLAGDGTINRQPFVLRVSGGPLINIDPDKPYPFDAYVRAAATTVTAKGSITKPFDLGRFNAALTIAGNDLNDLYALTNLALPNTPPYRLSGNLTRNQLLYTFNGFNGRVGGSDLGGNLSVDTKNKRPYLKAALRSRKLDFADLGTLFGAGKAGSGDAQQAAVAAEMKAERRLLPDATLNVTQVRAMDADVTYRAESVLVPNLPLRKVSLDLSLKDGVLKFSPASFDFPQGTLKTYATLNASKATPTLDLDARVTNVRLENFVPQQGGVSPIEGTLLGRARLSGAGNSVHRVAATSDGVITAVIPRGEIRRAFAELMGLNILPGIPLLLGKDQEQTTLRCVIADFQVNNGVLRARRLVIDTGKTTLEGKGTVNLGTEVIDLEFEGDNKTFRTTRVLLPFTIGGKLVEPKFGVKPGGAIAQAGAAVALGALLSPLAAIIPFIDPGGKDSADCAGLLRQAGRGGAPVAGATAAAAREPASKEAIKAEEERLEAREDAAKDRRKAAEKAAEAREEAAEDRRKAAEKAAKERREQAEDAAKDRRKAAERAAKAQERAREEAQRQAGR